MITRAMEGDPAFRLASWLVKVIYPQLRGLRRIEAPPGVELVDSLCFRLKGLSSAPREDVRAALEEMIGRGLLVELEDGALEPKHGPRAPQAVPTRAAAPNDNDAAAESKRLAENKRVAGYVWAKAQQVEHGDPRSIDELRAYHAAHIYGRKRSPLRPAAPAAPNADLTASPSAVASSKASVPSEKIGGEKESSSKKSFSLSPDPEEPETKGAGEATEPDLTDPNLTERQPVRSEPGPELPPVPPAAPRPPTPRELVETFLPLAEAVMGEADEGTWLRLGERMARHKHATRELVMVMGELASRGDLYLQKKHPMFPVGLLVGSRDGDSPVLWTWMDASKKELDERLKRARELKPGVARTEPEASQRAAAAGGLTTSDGAYKGGVYVPPWQRNLPPRPK